MIRSLSVLALWIGIALLLAAEVHIRSAGVGPDMVTYHNDTARTGQNLSETILTTSAVSASTFGKIKLVPTDGKVDAQPLYLSGVAIPGQGTHNDASDTQQMRQLGGQPRRRAPVAAKLSRQ